MENDKEYIQLDEMYQFELLAANDVRNLSTITSILLKMKISLISSAREFIKADKIDKF